MLELIDQADIFQLFWSSNSMNSEYVRREWEHAQALGRRGFIRPTYWEVPMPQSNNPRLPPDELAKLHFHGFSEEVNDEDFASTRSPAIPLSDYEEWARRRAVEKALSPPNAPSPSTEPAGGWPHAMRRVRPPSRPEAGPTRVRRVHPPSRREFRPTRVARVRPKLAERAVFG